MWVKVTFRANIGGDLANLMLIRGLTEAAHYGLRAEEDTATGTREVDVARMNKGRASGQSHVRKASASTTERCEVSIHNVKEFRVRSAAGRASTE